MQVLPVSVPPPKPEVTDEMPIHFWPKNEFPIGIFEAAEKEE